MSKLVRLSKGTMYGTRNLFVNVCGDIHNLDRDNFPRFKAFLYVYVTSIDDRILKEAEFLSIPTFLLNDKISLFS